MDSRSSHPVDHAREILPLAALSAILPALVVMVISRQSLSGQAAPSRCIPIARVNIHPGEVLTFVAAPPVEMSALAFDVNNRPISARVDYEWGISSTGSIGNLKPHQEIALFKGRNPGTGNVWVRARNKCTLPVTTSVPVTVTSLPPSATPLPLPSPRSR